MKKLLAILLSLLMLTSALAACSVEIAPKDGSKENAATDKPTAAPQTSTPAPTPEVNNGMVEITVPAAFTEVIPYDEAKTYAEENGFTAAQNPDGSYTYRLTEQQRQTLLEKQKANFGDSIAEILNSDYYAEVKDIRYSDNYSELSFICDKAAAEQSQFLPLAVYGLGWLAPLYQIYQGDANAKTTISLVDEATNQAFQTFISPDELVWDDGSQTDINTTGEVKLTAAELTAVNAEIDALFQPAPENGQPSSPAEINAMTENLEQSPGDGDTLYTYSLLAKFERRSDGSYGQASPRLLTQRWEREYGFARRDVTYIRDADHPDSEGETDCELYVYGDSGPWTYSWRKSEATGKILASAVMSAEGSLDFHISNIAGPEYLIYPDQTIGGHPCKVFGVVTDNAQTYYWFSEDLGRGLMKERFFMDTVELQYFYDLTSFDKDDSFYEPPTNVTFEEVGR